MSAFLSFLLFIKAKIFFARDDFQSAMKFIEEMEKNQPRLTAWDKGFGNSLLVVKTTMQGITAELHIKLANLLDVSKAKANLRKKSASDAKRTSDDLVYWERFKGVVFSRTFAAIYNVSIINMLVHLQISIVQRYNVCYLLN
jgi:hypothetical protein